MSLHGCTLKDLVRSNITFDLEWFALERLFELGSTTSLAYVMISTSYAATGRWKEVEEV